jgi:hypothetical protein
METVDAEDQEERRLRQVHQYLSLHDERNLRRFGVGHLEKGEKRLEVTKIESPDTALTAFTQLVAWRMDAQRAIVSLVDRNDQVLRSLTVHKLDFILRYQKYFMAESTPTLNLQNTAESDVSISLINSLWKKSRPEKFS